MDPSLDYTQLLTRIAYTALPSLTTALINALGSTAELFATPFNFNPKTKHYSAPFAEDAEFGAHQNALSFIWQGSCYCHHPQSSDVRMQEPCNGPCICVAATKSHFALLSLNMLSADNVGRGKSNATGPNAQTFGATCTLDLMRYGMCKSVKQVVAATHVEFQIRVSCCGGLPVCFRLKACAILSDAVVGDSKPQEERLEPITMTSRSYSLCLTSPGTTME